MTPDEILKQQDICLQYSKDGKSHGEIAALTGLSYDKVYRRISGAKKRERLDPALAYRLTKAGVTDLAGLHSGWLLEKDAKTGSGHSLYFYLGPDEEKISFADAIRDDHLGNTHTAIRLMKHAIYRLLETHQEVDVHLIRGNHDDTAYFAVLLALAEHYTLNDRVRIVVPETPEGEEFRVVSWGQCAFFPHHGDKAKPGVLKDVWADQFPDEWAAAKIWRLIPTAYFHHLKAEDLGGAHWRQFRTIHRPNRWARLQGLFSYASLCALTVHRDRGLEYETIANIKPVRQGTPK